MGGSPLHTCPHVSSLRLLFAPLPVTHSCSVILTSVPRLNNLRSAYLAQMSGWQGKGLAWAGILQRSPPLGPRPLPSLAGESPSQTPWVYKTWVMVHPGRGQRIPKYSGLQKRLLQIGNCRQDHHLGFPRLGRAAVIWGPARTPTQQGATEAETARVPQLNGAGPCRCPWGWADWEVRNRRGPQRLAGA